MTKKRELTEREMWFRERIGKILFRNDNGCGCEICQNVLKTGLLVENEFHADYLYDTEADYNAEGNPLRYFDTKEEAAEFAVQQKE